MCPVNELVPSCLKVTCRSNSTAVTYISTVFIPRRPGFMLVEIKSDGQILLCSSCPFYFLEILSINLLFFILLAVTTWICLTRYKLISSSHLPCRQHYNTHWSWVSGCAILNAKMNFPSFVFMRHPTQSPHTARLSSFQLLSVVQPASHWWTDCFHHLSLDSAGDYPDHFAMSSSLN